MSVREITKPMVSCLQVLDENGEVDEELNPALDETELVELYRAMVRARELDERMVSLQRQGRLGTLGSCRGQEAAAVGPAFALNEKDWLVPAFRELGAQLMRGLLPENVLRFYNGHEEGNRVEGDYRTLPTSIIVGAQFLHAVGVAYAVKYREEEDTAVVTFGGDGSTSQGDFHEALNFAAVWNAPVVFIIMNNHWAISLPREKQTKTETLAQKAIAYGMPGVQVDGNDVLAMYSAARDALERARRGDGPTLIEAVTYRLSMHTTADDPTKYRDDAEVREWEARDPIPRFRWYLESRGFWNSELEGELYEQVKADIDRAVANFEANSEFAPDVPFDNVFGSKDESTEEQRREFLAERERG